MTDLPASRTSTHGIGKRSFCVRMPRPAVETTQSLNSGRVDIVMVARMPRPAVETTQSLNSGTVDIVMVADSHLA